MRCVDDGLLERPVGKSFVAVLLALTIMLVGGCTPSYTLTCEVVPDDGGTVIPEGGTYKEEAQAAVIAQPSAGYRFVRWRGDAEGTGDALTITMTEDTHVIAQFERTYSLTTSVEPAGWGTVSPAGGTYDDGSRVSLTAEADPGYRFDRWSGDAEGTSTSVAITMTGDTHVVAHFAPAYTLTVTGSPEAGGTVKPHRVDCDEGDVITISAAPASDYLFHRWKGDVTDMDRSTTVRIVGDTHAVADFRMFYSPELAEVSQGLGVSQASAYYGRQHPMVLVDSNGERHGWSDRLPPEWLPTSVSDTQLVAIVGEQRDVAIESCRYSGDAGSFTLTRYQFRLEVELREARTGELLGEVSLRGTTPRECQRREYYNTRVEGSLVSFDQVQEWLEEMLARPSPAGDLIYEDDFSDPQSGWPRESWEEGGSYYADDAYHVEVKEEDWSVWFWNTGVSGSGNCILEVDARLVEGPDRAAYGLVFHLQDVDNFYYFRVSPDGAYHMGKSVDDTWNDLSVWRKTGFVNLGQETNRLRVVCRGSEFELHVNGHHLTTVVDDTFAQGYVGVCVGTPEPPTVVAFDSIRMYELW